MRSDTYIIRTEHIRENLLRFIRACPLGDVRVQITAGARRTSAQNDLMWARLDELAERMPWDGEKLTSDEWKDLLSACWRKQKVVRGVEGGLVFLGAKTSRLSVGEMNDLLHRRGAPVRAAGPRRRPAIGPHGSRREQPRQRRAQSRLPHRDAILIELNPEYVAMARQRIERDATLFAAVKAETAA